jgi:hypothetical protein
MNYGIIFALLLFFAMSFTFVSTNRLSIRLPILLSKGKQIGWLCDFSIDNCVNVLLELGGRISELVYLLSVRFGGLIVLNLFTRHAHESKSTQRKSCGTWGSTLATEAQGRQWRVAL